MTPRITTAILLAGAMTVAGCSQTMSSTDSASSEVPMATSKPMKTSMAKNPMVGGAEMFPTRNIIENAVNSKDHTTLVAAVKAAGLVDTLSGPGPFTVFAPTNAAFARLGGAVDKLMMPEAKDQLTGVLTYHVLPGRVTAADIMAAIKASPTGVAEFTTVNGAVLRAMMDGRSVALMGANGSKAFVTTADVMQSNGVIHSVNGVLLPS